MHQPGSFSGEMHELLGTDSKMHYTCVWPLKWSPSPPRGKHYLVGCSKKEHSEDVILIVQGKVGIKRGSKCWRRWASEEKVRGGRHQEGQPLLEKSEDQVDPSAAAMTSHD
eukprot:1161765-Pelagomonas_calceolata.AAC.2